MSAVFTVYSEMSHALLVEEAMRLRAENAKLREAGADCANDLEAHINAEYPEGNRDNYPHIRRQYERCIAPVEAMRKLLPSENLAQDSDRNR